MPPPAGDPLAKLLRHLAGDGDLAISTWALALLAGDQAGGESAAGEVPAK
jgi:hypothetical protein